MLKINFKTTAIAETKDFGKFELSPLESGFGLTLGNALRRVLLANLKGAAITSAQITGVTHQFTSLEGMAEDVVELLLNLKQVKVTYEGDEPIEVSLKASGITKVKAGDIKVPANVTIVNKSLVLANLSSKKSNLDVKLKIQSGYGYLPVKGRQPENLGEIVLDASFSPVVRVNYKVESSRVGRKIDLDKLILEVYTDGSIKPSEAINQASEILIRSFDQIINPVFEAEEPKEIEAADDNESLKLSVEELDLPTRIANALRNGGYATVKELSLASKSEISKVKNLGGKSIDIILDKLKEKGVEVK